MKIRSTTYQDLSAVEQLLSENDLPVEGVRENFSNFLVAEEGRRIVGTIGLESFDSVALLRSAAVSKDVRSAGIGRQLVESTLENARERGIEEVFLLTTTAEKYFPRFGFSETSRDLVPAVLKASAEFQGACPDSAIVMRLPIVRTPAPI
jgi:N-acetylglutamate synthase-like GNAT family acetyltransferase